MVHLAITAPALQEVDLITMSSPVDARAGVGDVLSRSTQVGRLLEQNRAPLYGYIFACVRNHADADDIFQIVSVVIAESIDRLRDEAGFLPWAREIARRRILEYRRGRRRDQFFDPVLITRLAEAAQRVDQATARGEDQRAALDQCLETLPPNSRRLIQMRYDGSVEDMNQLADRTGRTVQSVYAQLKRIKMALRECVARRLAQEAP